MISQHIKIILIIYGRERIFIRHQIIFLKIYLFPNRLREKLLNEALITNDKYAKEISQIFRKCRERFTMFLIYLKFALKDPFNRQIISHYFPISILGRQNTCCKNYMLSDSRNVRRSRNWLTFPCILHKIWWLLEMKSSIAGSLKIVRFKINV